MVQFKPNQHFTLLSTIKLTFEQINQWQSLFNTNFPTATLTILTKPPETLNKHTCYILLFPTKKQRLPKNSIIITTKKLFTRCKYQLTTSNICTTEAIHVFTTWFTNPPINTTSTHNQLIILSNNQSQWEPTNLPIYPLCLQSILSHKKAIRLLDTNQLPKYKLIIYKLINNSLPTTHTQNKQLHLIKSLYDIELFNQIYSPSMSNLKTI